LGGAGRGGREVIIFQDPRFEPGFAWSAHHGERRRFGHEGCMIDAVERLRMLMPPSRTRETCPRSHIAPILAGENLQHMDMSCMSHSVCLYAIRNIAYIID
jgi:hypothetical protein